MVNALTGHAFLIVWTGFVVGPKLVPVLDTLLPRSQCEAEVHFVASDDKRSSLASEVHRLLPGGRAPRGSDVEAALDFIGLAGARHEVVGRSVSRA